MHIGRRFIAFVLDWTIFSGILTVLFAMVFGVSSDTVRLSQSSIASSEFCQSVTLNEKYLEFAKTKLPDVDINFSKICVYKSFYFLEDRKLHFGNEKTSGTTTTSISNNIPVNQNGYPVSPFYADYIFVILIGFLFYFITKSRLKKTLGMKVLGLSLISVDGRILTDKMIAIRITFLFLFLLFPSVASYLTLLIPYFNILMSNLAPYMSWITIFIALIGVFYLWAWIRPYEIFRGWPEAFVHDVLSGTRVVLASQTIVSE